MDDPESARDDEDWLTDDDTLEPKSAPDVNRPWKILIVDDERDVHASTRLAIKNISYGERPVMLLNAHSAAEGFELMREHPDVALVLLDVVMETDDAGLRLVERIRGELLNRTTRIVLRTGQPGQAPEQQIILQYDINDYKSKTELTVQKLFTTVISSLRAYENLLTIEKNNQQLVASHQATVVALADLAEYRDQDTGEHVLRVQKLTDAITQELRAMNCYPDALSPEVMDMIGMASILHDVGKVGTPDHILFKPGRLNADERVIMEQHAAIGAQILHKASRMVEGVSYLSLGSQISGSHHEHYDGNGYPQRLKGEDIPLPARIISVVDVFDALLNRRPYKEPWSLKDTMEYIKGKSGTQFDPNVVEALERMVRDRRLPNGAVHSSTALD